MIEALGFFILFASGGALVNLNFGWINYLLVAGFSVIAIVVSGKVVLRFRFIVAALLFIAIFSAVAIGRGEAPWTELNGTVSAKVIICIISSLFLLQYPMYTVISRLTRLFEWLLIFSLITFVILNIAPTLAKPIGFLRLGDAVNSFFYVAYYRSVDLWKFGFVRNQGIFWEPGVYAFFITFFFLLKVHFLQSTKRLWLYALCMLSSVSVGGIAIFMVALGHYLYSVSLRNRLDPSSRAIMDLFTTMMTGLGVVLALWGIGNTESFLKVMGFIFQRDFINDPSTTGRIRDLIYGFVAASERPLFGHGDDWTTYYDLTLFLFRSSKEFYGGGVTNSIVAIYYNFGIIILCLYLWLMRCFARTFAPDHPWAVFFILVLLLMHEPLHMSMFLLFLLIYSGAFHMKHKRLPRLLAQPGHGDPAAAPTLQSPSKSL